MIDFLLGLFCLFVCLFVSPSLCLVRFGQLLCYADKCIVNIMKVYIERNNLQVEFIRCRKKMLTSFTCTFAKQIRRFRTQNHFGSVSDRLAIECMATETKIV